MSGLPLFRGRLSRSRFFWLQIAISLIVSLVIAGLSVIAEVVQWSPSLLVWVLLAIATGFLLQLSIAIPRVHDLNYSAWQCLLLLIPIVNLVFVVDLLLRKGTPGPNRFGQDPLERTNTSRAGRSRQLALLVEFLDFIAEEKKWWLVPLILVLLLVGALVIFASSSPLAPFIYPLF